MLVALAVGKPHISAHPELIGHKVEKILLLAPHFSETLSPPNLFAEEENSKSVASLN